MMLTSLADPVHLRENGWVGERPRALPSRAGLNTPAADTYRQAIISSLQERHTYSMSCTVVCTCLVGFNGCRQLKVIIPEFVPYLKFTKYKKKNLPFIHRQYIYPTYAGKSPAPRVVELARPCCQMPPPTPVVSPLPCPSCCYPPKTTKSAVLKASTADELPLTTTTTSV